MPLFFMLANNEEKENLRYAEGIAYYRLTEKTITRIEKSAESVQSIRENGEW